MIDEQSYWLRDTQMERLKPFFPKSHGKPASMTAVFLAA